MGRSALLALLPALLIVTGWQALEQPVRGGEFAVAAALAVCAAILPRRSLRIGASLVAAVAVASFAFDVSVFDARPFDRDHNFLDPVLNGFGGGLADFYEVSLPFNPEDRPLMHGAIVLAVFAFTLLATLAIVARRPILAAAATFAGAAWPVTLVPEASSTIRGVLILAVALLLLAALRPGARPGSSQALLVGSAVVFAALVAVSSPSVAKGGFLDWQQWEPYTREAKPVSVQYVWDSDYDGIDFPTKATTVFTAVAARRTPYWRATTLDNFLDDHWQEDAPFLEPVGGGGLDRSPTIRCFPTAARDAENWLRQEITIEALQDSHLVGASVPVAYEEGRARRLRIRDRLCRPPRARPAVLGLELRRPADTGPACALAAAVLRCDPRRQPVPERRKLLQDAALRDRWARGVAASDVRRGRRAGGVRAAVPAGPAGRRTAAESVRRRGRARGLVPLERRVLLRREPAGPRGHSSARLVRDRETGPATASTSPARWR